MPQLLAPWHDDLTSPANFDILSFSITDLSLASLSRVTITARKAETRVLEDLNGHRASANERQVDVSPWKGLVSALA